ncbi:MAG TPA: FAD-dependent oxidoreductase [Sphingomicrobium sp.]|nr:FAD-dependent oxidoreductase [Sphingomicrobium sp.]
MSSADILVVGGGIAGLSAAASLSAHCRVVVLEGEDAVGYHSSGRSATMLHYALGNPLVRALTLASRGFFDAPPAGFNEAPLGTRMAVLIHAREDELAALDRLRADIAPFAGLERLDERGIIELCPVIRGAAGGLVDRAGIRLDPHALLQGHMRALRRSGGEIVTGARVASIGRAGRMWQVQTERGQRFEAGTIVNAAGAWADAVAELAGVGRIGLTPLRRTIITFDAPPGLDVSGWPFAKTVGEELYFAPESGRLFASPMDEVPTDPCDAQPDEMEVALAAYRIEERTSLKVERVHSRWAGLRTFAPDRHPVAGFDPRADGFFWLAGQGGFGLQTSPVMAAIVESLIAGTPWPMDSAGPADLAPARFLDR